VGRGASYDGIRAGSRRAREPARAGSEADARPGGRLSPFSTPALIRDLDIFDANVAAMARLLEGTGKTVRPHVKAHRSRSSQSGSWVAGGGHHVLHGRRGGGDGAAGIDDILVANEVVGDWKIERLVALAQAARITVAADAPEPVAALSRAAVAAGVTVEVLIDVDTGLGRCGVATPREAIALAGEIAGRPGLRLAGIMGYEGRVRLSVAERGAKIAAAYAVLADVRNALEAHGTRFRSCPAAERPPCARRSPTRCSPSCRQASMRRWSPSCW